MFEEIVPVSTTPEEQRAAIALTRLKGLGAATALQALAHYKTAAAVLDATDTDDDRLRTALCGRDDALRRADAEMAFCEKNHIRVLPLTDTDYPARLRATTDAPPVLFFRGTADLNARRMLAVVGTRHITEYGRDICRHLCEDLAAAVPDCVIVSGLAYGVDIHAHRGALDHAMPTIGVMAHGLDRIYPAVHRDTAARMTQQGGLLTEYVSGTVPERGNFLARNRIVAGMSDATIVVESAKVGGALSTARLALEYSHDVMAFPGRATDPYSEGCNNLIRASRATLVTSAADILATLKWDTQQEKPAAVQRQLFPDLSTEETLIVEALKTEERLSVSRIQARTRLPFNSLNQLLFKLELKGVLRALPGGLYRLLR